MDKIYSRKRIKIPRVKCFYSNNKFNRKIPITLLIIIIAIVTFYSIMQAIIPIFEGACVNKATQISTEIMNYESSEVLKRYEYKDIVDISNNKENGNNLVKINVVTINEIASDIAIAIERKLANLENEKISMPLGALTGSKYLSGSGPRINIKVYPVGNVLTDLKTEYETTGINQTVYRIYLELRCITSILTPYNKIEKEVINQVLLVETVIVGGVPNTYYNLQGIKEENLIDIIE